MSRAQARSSLHLTLNCQLLNRGQRLFLRSNTKFVLMSGGFGAGKTTAAAIKVLQLAAANPGIPGLLVAQSLGQLKSTILRAINRLMPRGHKLRIIDPSGERYITFDGVTPIYLRTAKTPETMDGLDVGWVVADEIRHYSKRAYEIMIGRRRIKCPYPQVACSSTPSMGWMADEFDSNKRNRELICAPTVENAHNLEPGYVEDLRLSYSPRMQRAILDGEFAILEGAVYEAFSAKQDSPWILTEPFDPAKHYGQRTILGFDPGYRRPALVWAKQTMDLEWTIFHQMMPDNISASELVMRVNAWNEKNAVAIDEVWCDPAASQKGQAVPVDVISALRGLEFRGSRRNIRYLKPGSVHTHVDYGVERTRVLLGDPENGLPIRLKFTRELWEGEKKQKYGPSNRGVIRSLSAYSYPNIKDGRPIEDAPVKDGVYEHAADAARYLAVGLWLATPKLRALEKDPTYARKAAIMQAA